MDMGGSSIDRLVFVIRCANQVRLHGDGRIRIFLYTNTLFYRMFLHDISSLCFFLAKGNRTFAAFHRLLWQKPYCFLVVGVGMVVVW